MNRRPAKAKTSVCWFAPLQLLRTAQQVAIATVFGQNADARVIEALARPLAGTTLGPGTLAKTAEDARRTPGIHDYSGKHTPFWIDYIADTGDGWDATYTVAYYASQPTLALDRAEAAQGTPILSTRRGDILILGGDEVYPFANYEITNGASFSRIVAPFHPTRQAAMTRRRFLQFRGITYAADTQLLRLEASRELVATGNGHSAWV